AGEGDHDGCRSGGESAIAEEPVGHRVFKGSARAGRQRRMGDRTYPPLVFWAALKASTASSRSRIVGCDWPFSVTHRGGSGSILFSRATFTNIDENAAGFWVSFSAKRSASRSRCRENAAVIGCT